MMLLNEIKCVYVVKLTQINKEKDTSTIIDYLKAGNPVIVNFSEVESSFAFTSLYNLLGATYALDGYYYRISNEVYIFSTKEINMS